jgi:hypothetical protein
LKDEQYELAVDTLERYVRATAPVFALAQMLLPNMESEIEYALLILKEHPDYGRSTSQIN